MAQVGFDVNSAFALFILNLLEDNPDFRACVKEHLAVIDRRAKDEIHPKLYEIASSWRGLTNDFCMQVLILPGYTSHALSRANLTPLDILNFNATQLQEYKGVGVKSIQNIIDARSGWRPA